MGRIAKHGGRITDAGQHDALQGCHPALEGAEAVLVEPEVVERVFEIAGGIDLAAEAGPPRGGGGRHTHAPGSPGPHGWEKPGTPRKGEQTLHPKKGGTGARPPLRIQTIHPPAVNDSPSRRPLRDAVRPCMEVCK